jgi:hypothetical protein
MNTFEGFSPKIFKLVPLDMIGEVKPAEGG